MNQIRRNGYIPFKLKKKKNSLIFQNAAQGKSVLVPKFFLPKNTKKLFKLDFKMSEIAQHNTRKSCWIVIEGHVYDVTNFIDKHPGGWLPMVNMGGKVSLIQSPLAALRKTRILAMNPAKWLLTKQTIGFIHY